MISLHSPMKAGRLWQPYTHLKIQLVDATRRKLLMEVASHHGQKSYSLITSYFARKYGIWCYGFSEPSRYCIMKSVNKINGKDNHYKSYESFLFFLSLVHEVLHLKIDHCICCYPYSLVLSVIFAIFSCPMGLWCSICLLSSMLVVRFSDRSHFAGFCNLQGFSCSEYVTCMLFYTIWMTLIFTVHGGWNEVPPVFLVMIFLGYKMTTLWKLF